jgi:signal transduction histidine kinase
MKTNPTQRHAGSPRAIQHIETNREDAVCTIPQYKTGSKGVNYDNIIAQVIADSPINFFVIDDAGVVTIGLGRGGEPVDIKSQELVGRSIYDISQDIPEVKTLIPELLKEKTGITTLHLRDRELDIWHTPLRDDRGRRVGSAVIIINVTERWRIEEKLREEQALLEDMLRYHERDRKLIAYEIHDGLVQDITAAHMLLTFLSNSNLPPSQIRNEVGKTVGLVKKALDEARQLIGGLRPPILDELGVISALSVLIDGLQSDHLTIDFTAKVQFERLEPLLEETIFRIVQQAINNIQCHSRAEQAEVRLTQEGEWLHLEIKDWGIGFDPASVSEDRFGLQGIRERARLMRGRAVIDSAPGKGTRIIVDLPVAYTLEKN